MTSSISHYEFAILCAKVEEMRQVLAVLDGASLKKTRGSNKAEQVYEIPSGSGDVCRLLVATCSTMGHMTAAMRTAQIVLAHQPHIVIFLGTAASLRPDSVQVGDVVVPRKAFHRFYDKISEKGQKDYEARAAEENFKEHFLATMP